MMTISNFRMMILVFSVFFLIPLASAACDYSGTWATDWGDMTIIHTGQWGEVISGSYEHDSGKMTGHLSGTTVTGRWSEAPSYSGPSDAGGFVFTFKDCNSFSGTWGYDQATSGSGTWSGTRKSGPTSSTTPASSGSTTGSLPGTWDWFTGAKVYIHPDGTFEAWTGNQKSNSGTWTGSGNKYTLNWVTGSYVDTLTLSSDGKSLDGTNNNGLHVTATKSSSSDTVGGTTTQPAKKSCTGSGTSIYVDDRTMNPGQEVVIPIMMCNAKDIANMDLSVGYDSSALQFKDAVKGSLNSNVLFESNNVGNKVKIAFAGKNGFSGSGSIAILTFKVTGQNGASSPITVTVDSASTSGGNPISIPVDNGKVIIGNPNPNDPDGDGKVTSLDALIALQISVGKRPNDTNYDVTKDGTVNSNDARQILKLAVQ